MTREQVLRIAINIYRSKLGQLPESACIEEYNERAQTAPVRLEYISDLIEPAIVEINLKRNAVNNLFGVTAGLAPVGCSFFRLSFE